VVSDYIDQSGGALEIMMLSVERFMDSKQFFVMDIIVELRSR
jgi:hypothetical protein